MCRYDASSKLSSSSEIAAMRQNWGSVNKMFMLIYTFSYIVIIIIMSILSLKKIEMAALPLHKFKRRLYISLHNFEKLGYHHR